MKETQNPSWTELLLEGERLDELGRRGYRIIQNPKRFCFGMDAVLLSAFAEVREGESALDLGTGTGIIPILLEARGAGRHYAGLEIQEYMAQMAGRSVLGNGLSDKITIRQGDIKEASSLFGRASFDVVTCNPPYMNESHGLKNPMEAKAIARHEILCTLEDVISQSASLLKPGGRFYMVHRPRRLPEIIRLMQECRLEPKRLRLVHSFLESEANMVLVEGVRGGRPYLKLEAPLIIYRSPGVYTDEVMRLYKED